MARSGWAAVVVTVVLVGILGTGAATERAADADNAVRPLVESLTTFPAWDSDRIVGNGDLLPAVAAKLVVVLVAIFLLAFFAGRAESGTAAFLAGWGAMVVACTLAGGVYYVVADLTAFDGELADQSGGALAPLVREMNTGTVFAFYTGWVVAAAVAVTRRTATVPVSTAAPAPASAPGPAGPPPEASGVPPRRPGPAEPQLAPAPQLRMPVATWPPMPAHVGTVPPSPAWAPPRTSSPLPAIAVPRDRTATGLPRRQPSGPDRTKTHPGVPGPSADQDPTTTL